MLLLYAAMSARCELSVFQGLWASVFAAVEFPALADHLIYLRPARAAFPCLEIVSNSQTAVYTGPNAIYLSMWKGGIPEPSVSRGDE